MTNPIDNGSRIPGTGISGSARAGQAQGGKTQGSSSAGAAATTALDSRIESERLQQVREKIDGAPDVDMERVEAIKQAISEGNYPIDPKRIAAKFAELEGLLND